MDFNRTLALIRGMLFEPRVTSEGYAAENRDWQYTAITLTLPLIVASAIAAWLVRLIFSGFYLLSGGGIPGLILGIILGLAAIALLGFVLAALAGAFKGANVFSKAFACASLAMVPMYVAQVFGAVPLIGPLILIVAVIWSLVLLYRMIPLYLAVPDDKRLAHFIVSVIALLLIYAVLTTLWYPGYGSRASA
ncbi:hypothetical protein BH24PSE2_BH24PSE2_02670 [soil metagenome]